MIIYGKEYKLKFNIWASGQIADKVPEGNIENLDKYLDYNLPQNVLFNRIAEIAVILNKAAIMVEHFESGLPIGEWEHKESLSVDMLLSLSAPEFIKVQEEVVGEMINGGKTSVEVAVEKKTVSEAEE